MLTLSSVRTRAFTVDEYRRMRETGILSEDDRVELIDGEVVQMSPIGSRHAACVDRLAALFHARLADRAQIRVQSPIALDDRSEPEPELALLRRKPNAYADAHPGARDVFLVVEVGDDTVDYDRSVKVPRYASAGIPEVWMIDLREGRVDVFRNPGAAGYLTRRSCGPGQAWECEGLAGAFFAFDEVLPQA